MGNLDLKQIALTQLDDVLAEWGRLKAACTEEDFSDLGDAEGTRFVTRAWAVVQRFAPRDSPYVQQARDIVEQRGFVGYVARHIVGVVESVRVDVAAGFLGDLATLIHGEVFSDFLEMAQHLLEEKYKDAAAVIAGSSLEAQLRQLCARNDVAFTDTNGRPKKADQLNADLTRASIYSKLDQKNVTAWLDLRNKAAHGHYGDYEAQQVGLAIAGIRDFIVRNPA
jgi:hypothetical protein